MTSREAVGKLLESSGFSGIRPNPGETVHRYKKITFGIVHSIEVVEELSEITRNWSRDLERMIWDACEEDDSYGVRVPCLTDRFICELRRLGAEALLGDAAALLDLTMLVSTRSDSIDWSRVKEIRQQFPKVDWLFTSLLAIRMVAEKCGTEVSFPQWVSAELGTFEDTFWPTFIESRMQWGYPDMRLLDYTRAHAKLCKGA